MISLIISLAAADIIQRILLVLNVDFLYSCVKKSYESNGVNIHIHDLD